MSYTYGARHKPTSQLLHIREKREDGTVWLAPAGEAMCAYWVGPRHEAKLKATFLGDEFEHVLVLSPLDNADQAARDELAERLLEGVVAVREARLPPQLAAELADVELNLLQQALAAIDR
jgi:hypothetical protein